MPDSPDDLLRRAVAHHQANRIAEAEPLYRQLLALDPNNAAALHLLGLVALQTGHPDQAADLIGRSLKLKPAVPRAWYNLAESLRHLGRLTEAIAAYHAGFSQDRPLAADITNFGCLLRDAGQLEQAETQFRRAIAADPNCVEAHNDLGNVLQELGNYPAAVTSYRSAIAINPNHALSHNNMGTALEKLDRLEEAEAAHRRAIELDANFAGAYTNLGFVLRRQGRFQEALDETRKSLALNPAFPDAIWNIAHIELTLGNWPAGLEKYESRVNIPTLPRVRKFPQPRWTGSDPSNRTILIHDEQGFGDVLMAARFIPLVASLGARVILLVQPPLARLLATVPGVAQVVTNDQDLPPFDLHAPIMSLPFILKMTPDRLPAQVPYLHPQGALIEQWAARLKRAGIPDASLKVGLTWQGQPRPDPARTIDPMLLAPLAAAGGVTFVSLQKDPASFPPFRLINLMGEITDFADTAAVMSHLDLIITIDTATAHLAGALARPTWTLLPHVPDWRWQLQGDRTIWYPTMRLFRQPKRNDWPSVIQAICAELANQNKD